MKVFLTLFLLFSFFTSIAGGEEACCSVFEGSGYSASIEKVDSHDSLHFCEGDSEPSDAHDNHFHFCVGCSHTPFLKSESSMDLDLKPVLKPKSTDIRLFVSNPFLDGPFQPPKA